MSSEPIIETWFPKTLYVVKNLHTDKLSTYRKEILKIVSNKSVRTNKNFVDTTHGFLENDLKHNEIFNNLVKDLTYHCNNYLTILGYSPKAKIINMWANLSKKGDYLFPHNHPNSLISGAFYVSATNDNDLIEFFDNINNMTTKVSKETNNIFSYQTCVHQCIPGKLIMFKSDFLHGCPALQGDEKIVISFNAIES